jgi:hypothetical protein
MQICFFKKNTMIGVISKDYQKPIVEEFFQLFKVPWEFYDGGKTYDVIITTNTEVSTPAAQLVIISGPEKTPGGRNHAEQNRSQSRPVLLEHLHYQFPVYRDLSLFESSSKAFIKIKDRDEKAGIEYTDPNRRTLRIGYDLFDEIAFLLSHGQPVEYAQIPTAEIHIAMLRSWILDAGIPLIEVPPVPSGYTFTVCLTHDVDFMNIRDHKFDRSVLGFISRVLFPHYVKDLMYKISWDRILKNWKALLSIPGVYLGLFRDFWFDIDRYMEIEKGICSTFFFIPFRGTPGDPVKNNTPSYRAARYNINDHKVLIEDLYKKGHEIGVHGIDAWHSPQKGLQELETVRQIAGENNVGIRMHWLYFSEDSPKALEEAGFLYDSTMGYNDEVGYKTGTAQVYLLNGSSRVFELPLNIMDTTLFYRGRMGLSEPEALRLCRRLMDDMNAYGGVFTINWHTRSLSPERNWDEFYIELLKILKTKNVWFATAGQAVNWFKKRRSFHFNDVRFLQNKVQIKLCSNNETIMSLKDTKDTENNFPSPTFSKVGMEGFSEQNNSPALLLRVHVPRNNSTVTNKNNNKHSFIDIQLSGESIIEPLPFNHRIPRSSAAG